MVGYGPLSVETVDSGEVGQTQQQHQYLAESDGPDRISSVDPASPDGQGRPRPGPPGRADDVDPGPPDFDITYKG